MQGCLVNSPGDLRRGSALTWKERGQGQGLDHGVALGLIVVDQGVP